MKLYLSLVFSMLIFNVSFSQNEGNIWYFGDKAGIDFNNDQINVLSNSNMNTAEACASIADSLGNLLLYTNSLYSYNSNHQTMSNSVFLDGNTSTTQTAILKLPGSDSLYYIFTLARQANVKGFRYSEIDMSLNGGLGDVTSNKNIAVNTPNCEKICIVQHANEVDYWLVVHRYNSDEYHSYLFSSAGLNSSPIVSNIGTNVSGSNHYTIGQSIANKKGTKLASVTWEKDLVEVFDFDNNTGLLSNSISLNSFHESRPYGVAFSPSGSLLYVSDQIGVFSSSLDSSNIYQYNLEAGAQTQADIQNSRLMVSADTSINGSLQLGPDNNIYIARMGQEHLGVIHHPDSLGLSCNIENEALFLDNKISQEGLPNFPNNIYNYSFKAENFCFQDSTDFFVKGNFIDSIIWDFGDVLSPDNILTDLSPSHLFSDTGYFEVTAYIYSGSFIDEVKKEVYIKYNGNTQLGNDTSLVENSSLLIDVAVNNATYLWQDGSTNSNFTIDTSGIYWVEIQVNSCMSSDTISVSFFEFYAPFLTDSVAWNESGSYLVNDAPYEVANYRNFIYLIGDTVIDSLNYSKVYYGKELFDVNDFYSRLIGVMREHNKKVYFINFEDGETTESLYYDFNIEVGETSFFNDVLNYIDSTEIEDGTFRNTYHYSGSFPSSIAEGIGNIERGEGGLLHPNGNYFFENSNDINCMFTPNEIIYKADWLDDDFDCYKLKPVSINELKNQFSIYPNPFESLLNFEQDLNKVQISIYSLTGHLILKLEQFSGNQINLIDLNEGVYILKIENSFHKIVKI